MEGASNRFDAILYSKSTNENSDAGHIECSRRSQVPHTPLLYSLSNAFQNCKSSSSIHNWDIHSRMLMLKNLQSVYNKYNLFKNLTLNSILRKSYCG